MWRLLLESKEKTIQIWYCEESLRKTRSNDIVYEVAERSLDPLNRNERLLKLQQLPKMK